MTPNLCFNQKEQKHRNYVGDSNNHNRFDQNRQCHRSRHGYANLFDIYDHVKELDRQLAIVRSSPPKIHHDGKEVTIHLDLLYFMPQEIEITTAGKMMIVKALATVYLSGKNSVDKMFKRKFVFPSNILHDTVSTIIDRFYMVTIKAKRF